MALLILEGSEWALWSHGDYARSLLVSTEPTPNQATRIAELQHLRVEELHGNPLTLQDRRRSGERQRRIAKRVPDLELLGKRWSNPDKGEDHFTFSSENPESEIDFIMYRPAECFEVLEMDVIEEPLVSDHRPLVLELRVVGPNEGEK